MTLITQEKGSGSMGRVFVNVRLTNVTDLELARGGQLPIDKVRSVDVQCMVDTGATLMCLPPEIIEALGLQVRNVRKAVTANGMVERQVFSAVEVKYEDRDAVVEVMEMPQGGRPLMGYIALELMDLVVNPRKGVLEGNPDHDGKMILDLL